MRFAIPVADDALDQHFGHCRGFALVDVDETSKTISSVSQIPAPEHEHGLLPPWLKERGVTHVIAGGIGTHARSLLEELSVTVISGAPSRAPLLLVAAYLNGGLETSEKTCSCHN